MKYLLVAALVLLVFWLWSHKRRIEKNDAARPPAGSGKQTAITEVVACDVCQVHLPRSEALIGAKGIYCSDAHRRQAGG